MALWPVVFTYVSLVLCLVLSYHNMSYGAVLGESVKVIFCGCRVQVGKSQDLLELIPIRFILNCVK